MRKFLWIPATAIIGAAILLTAYPVERVQAQAGCCLKRDNKNSNWVYTGYSFDKCVEENDKENDNIFDESGLIWWNSAC